MACAGLTNMMRHAAFGAPCCGLQMSTPEEEAAARAELCRTWEEDNWTAEQIQNCLQVRTYASPATTASVVHYYV